MVIAGSAPVDMPEKRISEALEIYVLSLSKDLSNVTLLKLPVATELSAVGSQTKDTSDNQKIAPN